VHRAAKQLLSQLRIAAAALAVTITVFTPAVAWNSLSHKAVAEIAWRQLDEATRQSSSCPRGGLFHAR
jgi:hypothetical protein